jgi:hypothetical protein
VQFQAFLALVGRGRQRSRPLNCPCILPRKLFGKDVRHVIKRHERLLIEYQLDPYDRTIWKSSGARISGNTALVDHVTKYLAVPARYADAPGG